MKKHIIFSAFLVLTVTVGCALDDGFQNGALSPRAMDVMVGHDTGDPLPDTAIGPMDTAPIEDTVQVIDIATADNGAPIPERYTYILALADTHIKQPDAEPANNLRALAAGVEDLPWDIQCVFVAGDIVYQLPYLTIEEFRADPADRFDIVQEIFESFPVPVYPALGNHDMDNGPIPLRDLAHQLFMDHFGVEPYYAVDLGTWKMLILSNFEGPTHDPDDPGFDPDSGSLGPEQLAWMEEQVADGKPVILMIHFPGFIIKDLSPFIEKHRDTVRLLLSGHSHAWMNLSDNWGVPSLVIGTSQWDADNQMIIELDNWLHTWRMINWDKVHWGSGYSLPWNSEETAQ